MVILTNEIQTMFSFSTTIKFDATMMGLTNSPSLDNLIKYTRPLWHDTDEHRRTINKSIQCRGQLPTSVQTVGVSSKSIFMSPEALQKRH